MRKRYKHDGDGNKQHVRWQVMRVAMAVEPMSDGDMTVCFAFHGATKVMLSHVFTNLKGKLFADYSMTEDIANKMLNGKCCRTLTVRIEQPDFHRLSLSEWPSIIRYLMERTFRCRVTYFEKYELFLNA